jgi:hypothetical protein
VSKNQLKALADARVFLLMYRGQKPQSSILNLAASSTTTTG